MSFYTINDGDSSPEVGIAHIRFRVASVLPIFFKKKVSYNI